MGWPTCTGHHDCRHRPRRLFYWTLRRADNPRDVGRPQRRLLRVRGRAAAFKRRSSSLVCSGPAVRHPCWNRRIAPPGCWPALLSGYTGREPLHMYLMVGIYVPFGSTDVTLRLASTLIGIASVPARYLPVGAIGTTPRRKHLCPDERLAVESITISRRQACVRTADGPLATLGGPGSR